MEPSVQDSITEVFDSAAASYDSTGVEFFKPVARRVVELAGLGTGERVLDIGSGRGACLFPAAERVGPTGHVDGIDIAPAMLAATGAEVRERGLDQVTLTLMDGTRPDFPPGSFDAVIGSMSIIFLPGLSDALARYAHLLGPGGRLVYSTPPLDPRTGFPDFGLPSLVTAVGRAAEVMAAMGSVAELFQANLAWSGGDDLADRMRAAGFATTDVRTEAIPVHVTSGAQFVAWTRTHGMRMLWDTLSPEHSADLERSLIEDVESRTDADGSIDLSLPVDYVVATTT